MPRLDLDTDTLAELRRSSLTHPDLKYRLRCQILIRSTQTRTVREVARQLGTNSSAVRATRRRFAESGTEGLLDHRVRNGRHRRRVTPDYCLAVEGLLKQSPQDFGFSASRWTRFMLVRVAAQLTGVVVSPSTIIRVVRGILDPAAVRNRNEICAA